MRDASIAITRATAANVHQVASTSNGPKPPKDTYTIRLKTELKGMTALRLEALTFEELPLGGPGRVKSTAALVSRAGAVE